jgi:cytochrome c oxidase subunit II
MNMMPPTLLRRTKALQRFKRCLPFVCTLMAAATSVFGDDWGMGASNSKLSQPDVFAPVSTPAYAIDTLAWFSIAVCAGIALVVAGLLAYSMVRFRARRDDDGREPPQVYGSNPIEFAWTVVPLLIVFVLILTTARTIYTVQAAIPPPGAIKVQVIGHQWWWEVRYPDLNIVTANEIHVPVSDPANPTPTFFDLESADVAHSFWVPQLAGKTDLIPNKKNTTWIDPHTPGTYLGQCAEFCGTEHGLMLLRVMVQPRAEWEQWIALQGKPAAAEPAVAHGRQIFESMACVNCHTVLGTVADGHFGPDLTHIMSRETLAAGAAMNTADHLKTWIKDPNIIKPGALMPAMNLSDADLGDITGYLESLR